MTTLAEPGFLSRLFLGRPFLISLATLLLIGATWDSLARPRAPRWTLAAIALMLTLASWMHGNVLLWGMPLAAFAAAQQWRATTRLALCTVVGLTAGVLLTGHPILFVEQTVLHPLRALGSSAPTWLLVGEFQPSKGSLMFAGLFGLGVALLGDDLKPVLTARNPLVWLAAGGWLGIVAMGVLLGLGIWYAFWGYNLSDQTIADVGVTSLVMGVVLSMVLGGAERYARARERQAERRAAEIVEIADTEPDAAVARNRIEARKWTAAKLLPKRYGDKTTTEITGPGGGPIEIVARRAIPDEIDEQRLRAIEAALRLALAPPEGDA